MAKKEEPKRPGNRKATDKALPLYIERIVFEYSTSGRGPSEMQGNQEKLTVNFVTDKLDELYGIKVSKKLVRDTLDAMVESYRLPENDGDPDAPSYLHPLKAITRADDESSEKALMHVYAVRSTDKIPDKGIAYQNEMIADNTIDFLTHMAQLERKKKTKKGEIENETLSFAERFLLSNVNKQSRAEIKRGLVAAESLSQVGKANTDSFDELIKHVGLIKEAQDEHCSVSFTYRKKASVIEPAHFIGVLGDFYYLVSVQNGSSDSQKGPKAKGPFIYIDNCKMYRVDQMEDVKKLKSKRMESDELFEEHSKTAERYLKATVNRLGDSKLVKVRIICHADEAHLKRKMEYAEAEFSNKEGYDPIHDTIHAIAAYDGVLKWALKWLDVFEVLEPRELREDIVKTITTRCVYKELAEISQ